MEYTMELLAPAGEAEIAKAAFGAGADACYIGGRWSARAYAKNFSDEQMQDILSYAHLRGKKIYVALNTMLYERELETAIDYTGFLYEAGVDAIIAADLGYIREVRRLMPDLPIHVSTQAGIQNAAGVRAMAALGCNRVVAARECTLEDLTAMAATGVEVEAFGHAAMCSGISGACLMSGVIGGRSGNRGRCAQPCRQEYTLLGKKAYHLSTKDLCTLDLVRDLMRAGVCSLKIEGRMKSRAYVASAVAAYRKVIDACQQGLAADTEVLQKELAVIFNRGGFTQGYLTGGRDITYPRKPGHIGVYVGKLADVRGGKALVKTKDILQKGDSIEVGSTGFSLAYADKEQGGWRIPVPRDAKAGDAVYLKSSPAILERAEEYAADRAAKKITLTFTAQEGGEAVLRAQMGDLSAEAACPVTQVAQKPVNAQSIREKLCKTGGTMFVAERCDVRLTGQPFLPVSQINALRREVLTRLEQALQAPTARPALPDTAVYVPAVSKVVPGGNYMAAQVCDAVQAAAAAKAGAERLYLAPRNAEQLEMMCAISAKEKWLVLPPFFAEKTQAWLMQFMDHHREQIAGVIAPNPGAARAAAEAGIPWQADFWCNAANRATAAQLLDWGASGITVSAEIDIQAISAMKDFPMEAVVYGKLPLMNLRHCPVRKAGGCQHCGEGALQDKLGYKFPMGALWAGECLGQVYNAVPMAAEELQPIRKAGVQGIRLMFTDEREDQVYQVVRTYGTAWYKNGRAQLPDGFLDARTNGHLYRGVE